MFAFAMAGLIGGAFLLGLVPAPSQALTLEEAVRVAIETHPTVLASKAVKRRRHQEVNVARSPFFPQIDARLGTGPEYSDTPGTRGRALRFLDAGNDGSIENIESGYESLWHTDSELSLRQMVFDGFETLNRSKAAKIRVRAANFQIRDAQELIALRAVETYHTVLRAREIVQLAEENVQSHLEVLEDVRTRAREGGGNIADVRQAEARTALSRTRLTEQRGDLRDAETDFREAVGVAPDDLSLPEPPEELVPETLDESLGRALAESPTIRAATTAVDARRTDIEASKGVFFPRVDIELAAQSNRDIGGSNGYEHIYQAFTVLRWNLFSGGGDIAATRRLAELATQEVHIEAEQRRLVEEQMRVDFNARQVAADKIPTLEDRVLAADQVVTAYRQQFQLGQRTLLDVLDVENELFVARVALVEGEYDFRVANYQILSTIGVLSPALGVLSADSEMMEK